MIIKCILKIFKWIKDHIFGVLVGSAGAGAAAAGVGIHNARKAKRINKNAVAIQKAALEKHDNAYQETQAELEELGESEKTAIDSFPYFADMMARIQGRPQIKTNVLSSVNLPNYEPEEIKSLSANLQMAIVGAGGAGAGALAGLAAFGAGRLLRLRQCWVLVWCFASRESASRKRQLRMSGKRKTWPRASMK